MADPVRNADAAMAIAASALRAQQQRMRVIAENIANSDSTSTVGGGEPYRRQMTVFQPVMVEGGGQGVRVAGVRADTADFKREYNPGHPAADAKGYVQMPNVDPLVEALDLKEAQRAYEANLNVIETARAMQGRTLDLLRK